MSEAIWQPLSDVLQAFRSAGRRPQFWLRDDDAVEPTAALDRLLELTGRWTVQAAIAVIPVGATDALAKKFAATPNVTVLVHGWSHENHAGPGEKKQELGAHRHADAVLADLERGLIAIRGRFCEKSLAILVPPWNRIDRNLLPRLQALGYEGVSAFGAWKQGPLPIVNSTIDIIDWHGTRGGRDPSCLLARIVRQLRAGLLDPSVPPVGILAHHLVHDETAWDFLEKLFQLTTGDCHWRSIGALLVEETGEFKRALPSA